MGVNGPSPTTAYSHQSSHLLLLKAAKIQFDYLRPDQAGKLFTRVLTELRGYTRPRRYAESAHMRLSQSNTLTPGDFATVVRQARALGERYDSERLLAALEEECRAK